LSEEKIYEAGWAMHTSDTDAIEQNAQDLDRAEEHAGGTRRYTGADGKIKKEEWDRINESIMAFEAEWHGMLTEGFRAEWTRDEGHDGDGDPVGACGLTKRAIFNIMDRAESYDGGRELVVLSNGSLPEAVERRVGLLHPCVDVANITFWLDPGEAAALTEEYETLSAAAWRTARKCHEAAAKWHDCPQVAAGMIRDVLMEDVKEFHDKID